MKPVKPFQKASIFAILAMLTLPCFAGEVAILKNGFSIAHRRHETVGDVTRLYISADGSSFVDVPTANIDHYEAAPDLPIAATEKSALRADGVNSLRPTARATTPAYVFPARPQADLTQVVNEVSGRYRLDPDLVTSVIKAESDFNPHAISPKGARGLMQLMPGTASQLGVPNTFDPQANVEGGTRYLRELLERYNFDVVKALAAYNAGPQKVERYGGVPPYYETRAYVKRIVTDFNKKKAAQQRTATKAAAAPKASLTKTKKSSGGSAVQARSGAADE